MEQSGPLSDQLAGLEPRVDRDNGPFHLGDRAPGVGRIDQAIPDHARNEVDGRRLDDAHRPGLFLGLDLDRAGAGMYQQHDNPEGDQGRDDAQCPAQKGSKGAGKVGFHRGQRREVNG